MKLVPLRQAQVRYMNFMGQKQADCLKLLTYKKDRSVMLRKEQGQWMLEESGYKNQKVPVDNTSKKLLKEAFAREFPRSTRLYMQEN